MEPSTEDDVMELIRFLNDEITELGLLIELMALALTTDEMPERQRQLLERILA